MISAPEQVHIGTENSQGAILSDSFAEAYPLNILIAEDNFVNKILIERILHKLGYQTSTVPDGLQALNSFVKNQYNVILMDVRMPEMDGYEATHVIREMTVDQPYIIAMTANAMSNDREECLQNGMNDYISKPLHMNEVISKLKTASEYCSGRNRK
jgi:CheY-like chemotaxis protein